MKILLIFRRVASQGQDVLEAELEDFVEKVAEHFLRGTDAGEMGHGLDAALVAQALDDARGGVAHAAAAP